MFLSAGYFEEYIKDEEHKSRRNKIKNEK